METDDLSINEFLGYVTASLSEEDSDVVFRRINTHTVARLMLREIQEDRQDLRLRILPDARVGDELAADLLVQIDDFDVRVVIADSEDNQLHIDSQELNTFLDLLEDNPNTVALVIVWTTDELHSIALTFSQVAHLLAAEEDIDEELKQAGKFKAVVENIIDSQIRTWDEGTLFDAQGEERSIEIRSIYDNALSKAMADETKRQYRIKERRIAARDYPYDIEHKLVMSVLDEALSERDVGSLVKKLTALRGLAKRD